MKTRYIVSLVVVSIIVIVAICFWLFLNRADIAKVFIRTIGTVGNRFRNIRPRPIIAINPTEVLDKVEKDEKLLGDLSEMTMRITEDQGKTERIVRNTRGVVKTESAVAKKKSVPLGQQIVSATKYKKISNEKNASEKYDKVLRQIESEKAKAAVLLTAKRTEGIKTQKLNIMKDLDMEVEIQEARKVVSKQDAEIFVRNHLTV